MVAFESQFRDAAHRTFWGHGFAVGSTVATFAQGVVLGILIQIFRADGRHFGGSSADCFTPFSPLTGAALVFGSRLTAQVALRPARCADRMKDRAAR